MAHSRLKNQTLHSLSLCLWTLFGIWNEVRSQKKKDLIRMNIQFLKKSPRQISLKQIFSRWRSSRAIKCTAKPEPDAFFFIVTAGSEELRPINRLIHRHLSTLTLFYIMLPVRWLAAPSLGRLTRCFLILTPEDFWMRTFIIILSIFLRK